MSSTQVILIILVLVAFALGWWARGRRAARRRSRQVAPGAEAQPAPGSTAMDAAFGAALTSFQAALTVWQLEAVEPSSYRTEMTRRAIATYERAGAAVRSLELDPESGAEIQAAHRRGVRAVQLLSAELSAHDGGKPLDLERERKLVAAERTLVGARLQLRSALNP